MNTPTQRPFVLAVQPSARGPAGAPAAVDDITFTVPNLPLMAGSELSCCSFSPPLLIMEALHALPGVRQVAVDDRRGQVAVVYDPGSVDRAALGRALVDAGFPPTATGPQSARMPVVNGDSRR